MPKGRSHTASQAIALGMKYVNKTPYVWGGNSLSQGCDCSHFISLVFGMPWLKSTAYTNSNLSGRDFIGPKSYSYSKVRVGDIVAMDGHVGMCGKQSAGIKYCLQSGGGGGGICLLSGMAGGSWTAIQRPKEGVGDVPVSWKP